MRRSPASSDTRPTGSTSCNSSLSAAISRWCSRPWCFSFWCSRYGLDPRFRLARRADAAGAAAQPAAHRLCAQGESSPAAPARPAAVAALSRSDSADAQGRSAGDQRILAVPCHSLYYLGRHLGGSFAGADLPQRLAVFLVGRSHRHHRAARQRPLLPGARRSRCRHQLRRHRFEPRGDDRLAGGTGDVDDRVHAGAGRGLHATLVHGRLHVSGEEGLRVSLGLALLALIMVAIAENARIPVDNPATHLELTMVHEAMVLEYSGRHLALIDLSSELKLLLYISVIGCLFTPWGIAGPDATPRAVAIGLAVYVTKLAVGGFLLAVFETAIAKMRVFRVPAFLGAALMLGLLATLLLFVSRSL